MKKFRVGVVGATGMVGQRFLTLLENHPWFSVECIAASERSKGRSYMQAVADRWKLNTPIPECYKDIKLYDAVADVKIITSKVDFIFCAVDMDSEKIKELEEVYAKHECPVISNNSAHRTTPDVPMIIPEVNPDHCDVIPYQRKRLNCNKGFIAVKSNCSIQSYVPALSVLMEYGITNVLVCTYQAISGAGKTLESCDEIFDNVIPYIPSEEDKSEKEPLKIFGQLSNGEIKLSDRINITSQCFRVPVSDGHMAAVFVSFKDKITMDQIKDKWNFYKPEISKFNLPSSPSKFLHYMSEENRPQTKLDRDIDNGMGISIGRLRPDSQYDAKFVCLSHNTIRGAAGGAILMAELLIAKGYIN